MGTQKNRLNEMVLLRPKTYAKIWIRKYLQIYAEIFCLSKSVVNKIQSSIHSRTLYHYSVFIVRINKLMLDISCEFC